MAAVIALAGCGAGFGGAVGAPGSTMSTGAAPSYVVVSQDAGTVSSPADAAQGVDGAGTSSAVETHGQGAVTPSRATGTGAAGAALTLLGTLAVKGRAPKTGYDRALFGAAWSDNVTVTGGHNGCDTRNDILHRDLVRVTVAANGCTILAGTLDDAYTGTVIAFTRGQATSGAVQIDHVVALMDAWQKGAQQLDPTERRNLANDPVNLQAVDGPTNAAKGSGDAATWLPPAKAYRCTYVSRQITVKAKYHLWVTRAEKDAMARVLAGC